MAMGTTDRQTGERELTMVRQTDRQTDGWRFVTELLFSIKHDSMPRPQFAVAWRRVAFGSLNDHGDLCVCVCALDGYMLF